MAAHTEDTYLTLAAPGEGEYRDRASKFLAYAYPIIQDGDWQTKLDALRKAHPKARHFCYAYRWGLDGNNWRANDDGEPNGSAGRPILGQIDSAGLTNVLVVVVRYFGGTLLGVPGLIQAYKTSAAAALAAAPQVVRTVEWTYQLAFAYPLLSGVMQAVNQLDVQIQGQDFAESCVLTISVRRSEAAPTLRRLKALVGNRYLEEIDDKTAIPGLDISQLP